MCVCACVNTTHVNLSTYLSWAYTLYSFDTYSLVTLLLLLLLLLPSLISWVYVFFTRSFISFKKPTWVMMHYDSMRTQTRHILHCNVGCEQTKFNKILLDFYSCMHLFFPFFITILPSFTKSGICGNREVVCSSVYEWK